MGQKVNPVGFRTGITEGWSSRWFAPKKLFGELLVEDQKIREFIDERLNRKPPYAAVARTEIERTREELKIILHTARPGVVIGPKGAEVDKLREELEALTQRKVKVDVAEIGNPDLDAKLIGEGIAEQLKKRASFRRVLKQKAEAAMNAGARGIKIQVAGRIGGAEIARTEKQILGSIPLHTLQASISYGLVHCRTPYGVIGIKVWVYRGMYADLEAAAEAAGAGRGLRRPRRR
ncbi:MAG: 30S ribosomal protein S3 [Phycisphaerales bacterium]|nr:30S ribosomal protein S3 [Phycisphaerales bacterium]